MPFTPFHLGPALLFGVPLRRWLDFPTFLIASVAVDARATLVFFGVLDGPLHGPLHTYLGATVIALVLTVGVVSLERLFPAVASRLGSVPPPGTVPPVALASITGTWLAVTLDAVLYAEMRPFFPLAGNPFLGLTTAGIVYGACAVAFIVGAIAAVALAVRGQWS